MNFATFITVVGIPDAYSIVFISTAAPEPCAAAFTQRKDQGDIVTNGKILVTLTVPATYRACVAYNPSSDSDFSPTTATLRVQLMQPPPPSPPPLPPSNRSVDTALILTGAMLMIATAGVFMIRHLRKGILSRFIPLMREHGFAMDV
jgi:hypothetical protein